MFKKITYLLSMILGIFLVFKLVNKEKVKTMQLTYPDKIDKLPIKKESVKLNDSNLNKRQKDILKLINKRRVLLPSDIYALHPSVSTRTLRRDMTVLVERDLVKQEGSTRDTKYILNN